MRIALFDLETWDLSPEFGPILCASVLSLPSEELITLRQDHYVDRGEAEDMVDDEELVTDLRDLLSDHHLLSAYYGKGFDWPCLQTRLKAHNEGTMNPKLFFDPIYAYRGWRGFKPKSSSLEDVAKFLGMEEEKKEMRPEMWLKARAGNTEMMDEAVERCESDVRLLRKIAEEALEAGVVRNINAYP